ncbi:MAG: hypothetical protein B7Z78_13835 [Rhodospirillales bacterium 20-60-12]|nr:MAG: hypothetical protein B7Z78_13835 [Rhodospirillales bacterium 20-60-12]HQT68687.1 glycosyltransferase 61 family protein [Acetobacteraceae bacterium]
MPEAPASGFLSAGKIFRLRLAPLAAPAPLAPLAIEDPTLINAAYIGMHRTITADQHFDIAAFGPLPVILNGPGLVWHQGALLTDPQILPGYALTELRKHTPYFLDRPRAFPMLNDSRPALVFHSWGVQVYGHMLIEMLPKLLMARRFYPHLIPVLDRQMPAWFLTILREQCGITPDHAIMFDSESEQLTLDRAVLISQILRPAGYHPIAASLYDQLAQSGAPPSSPTPRIFLRRGDFSNKHSLVRRMENEAELAIIAAEYGFVPIHPETLSFATQIGLFAQATHIIAETGSAPHNAVFSPAGTRIGLLRFGSAAQSQIAALRGHHLAVLTEGVVEQSPGLWHTDIGQFRRFLELFIA